MSERPNRRGPAAAGPAGHRRHAGQARPRRGGAARADRDRRHELPVPRRRRPRPRRTGSCCATAATSVRRVPGRAAGDWSRRQASTSACSATRRDVVRRLPRRDRPVRPAVLRHLAARGGDDGPAAAAAARGELGGAGATPASPRTRWPARATGVFVGITTNDYVQLAKLGGAGDARRLHGHRRRAQRRGRPRLVHARAAGPGMAIDTACSSSLVARAPGLPEPAARRVRPGPGRRRQPAAAARGVRVLRRSGGCWRPTGAARRSTPRPTASCAARAAAWSC